MSVTVLPRPQPIGLFPQPASFLALPAGLTAEEQAHLMAGRLPEPLPDSLGFLLRALEGDTDAALAALGDDDLARYNRFVLTKDPDLYNQIASQLTGDLRALLALTASAYALSGAELPDPASLNGELRAAALGALARRQRTDGDVTAALATLAEAAEAARDASPVLAAQLLASRANLLLQGTGEFSSEVSAIYDAALDVLEPHPLAAEFRASLAQTFAQITQQHADGRRHRLADAVKLYTDALRTFRRATHPEAFAEAQVGLALCYLQLPMREASDQLRVGIAVQSLREALEVYTPTTHPEEWSSAQLNLANALLYAPTTHPRENIAQAIDLYDEVLAVRTRENDPLGHARALTNQGNALAHAGLFDHAQSNLETALAIFREHGDQEGMGTALEILAQVEPQVRKSVLDR